MTEKKKLHEFVREMKNPIDGNTYHAVTLTANVDGDAIVTTQTGFSGITDEKPHHEIRAACQVIPEKMLNLWAEMKMPGVVVNNMTDLYVFSIIGGNAVVVKSLCERYFPSIFNEITMVKTGLLSSSPIDQIQHDDFRRSPTPKLRMTILKRDNYRCRVCGRSSDDNVDIVLHVHHFIPAERGGLTNESNLVTLCHTCHNGLNPHFDMQLSNVFQETFTEFNNIITNEDNHKDYVDSVVRYRRIMRERIQVQQTTSET